MPSGAPRKVYPPEMVARVRALYEGGMSQVEVADELGLSQKVIWKLMINHDIPRRPQVKRDQRGAKNSSWKGGAANYQALHMRVGNLRGKPQHCTVCDASGPGRSYDWANLTGQYDDPTDYQRMCRSCHWKHDGTIANLGEYAIRKEARNHASD